MNIPEYRQTVREQLTKVSNGALDGESVEKTEYYAEQWILQATKELILGLVGEDEGEQIVNIDTDGVRREFIGDLVTTESERYRNALRQELRNAIAEMGEK